MAIVDYDTKKIDIATPVLKLFLFHHTECSFSAKKNFHCPHNLGRFRLLRVRYHGNRHTAVCRIPFRFHCKWDKYYCSFLFPPKMELVALP